MRTFIKSKYNMPLLIGLLLLAVAVMGIIFVYSLKNLLDSFQTNNVGAIFKNILFVCMSLSVVIYFIFHNLTYLPKFSITSEGFCIRRPFVYKFVSWKEVSEIKLTGKQPFKFLFITMPLEATTILLKDGTTCILWVDYYKNKSQIRIALERISKANFNPILNELNAIPNQTQLSDYTIEVHGQGEEFNGNHIISFNGLFFYGAIVFVFYLLIAYLTVVLSNIIVFALLLLFLVGVPGIASFQMNYFILYENYLVVKNTLWLWRKDVYPIDKIREVVIEQTPHSSISLRLIMLDFVERRYPAGSLKDTVWLKLIHQLTELKVSVRDEVYKSPGTI